MTLADFLNEILVVIVIYQQPAEKVLSDVLPPSSNLAVFIYDNSNVPQALSNNEHVTYKHDTDNSGVSKAYNEAFVEAQRLHKKWMLLLDQDTCCDQHYFEKLFEAVNQYPCEVAFVPKLRDAYGFVSPFRWRSGRGVRIFPDQEKYFLDRYRFANSGLLVQCDAFARAGCYVEDIPLDFSDIAFGENLMQVTNGFMVVDVILEHGFSGSEKNSYANAMSRFNYFCLGAFEFGKHVKDPALYQFRALLRATHLSIRHRSINFIKVFLKYLRHG